MRHSVKYHSGNNRIAMNLYEHDAVFLAYASTVGLVTTAQFLKVRPFKVYLSVLKA